MASLRTSKKLIGIVLLMEAVILLAAFSKLITPLSLQGELQQSMGLLQLTYCAVLPFCARHRGLWVVSLLAFGAFVGFSVFALLQELPCGCFGSEGGSSLSQGIVLTILILAAMLALRECGWKGVQAWLLLIVCMLLFAVFGFLFASQAMVF